MTARFPTDRVTMLVSVDSELGMEIYQMVKALGLALGLAVFAHAVAAQEPPEVALAELATAKGLPPDCTLVNSAPQPFTIGLTIPDIRVPSNPWTGSDRAIVAAVRETVYGAPKLSDAPLMTTPTLRQFLLRLADGVDEAYVAAYEQKGLGRTFVYGLRFAASTQVPSLPAATAKPWIRAQVGAGRLIAAVHGKSGECADALASHMKTLLGDIHH